MKFVNVAGEQGMLAKFILFMSHLLVHFTLKTDMIEDELEVFFAQEDSDSESDIEEDEGMLYFCVY